MVQSVLARGVRCSKILQVETENMVSSWINPPTPPRMTTEACADQLMHADILYFCSMSFSSSTHPEGLALSSHHPLICQFSLSLPFCLCSVSCRRLGECQGVSVVLCCALFWSGPNAVALCLSFFLSFFCGIGWYCNYGSCMQCQCEEMIFSVSLGLCGCVCVCDFFFPSSPVFFLLESMNTNNK